MSSFDLSNPPFILVVCSCNNLNCISGCEAQDLLLLELRNGSREPLDGLSSRCSAESRGFWLWGRWCCSLCFCCSTPRSAGGIRTCDSCFAAAGCKNQISMVGVVSHHPWSAVLGPPLWLWVSLVKTFRLRLQVCYSAPPSSPGGRLAPVVLNLTIERASACA